MGAISSLLSRVLHALLVALAIGLIACYGVANSSTSKTNEWILAEEKVPMFSMEIIFVSPLQFCLVLSALRLILHPLLAACAPPTHRGRRRSLLVDTLLFLNTASILSYVAYYYNQVKAIEDHPVSSSRTSSSGGTLSGGSLGGGSLDVGVDSSKPYLAVIVVTGIFDFFLLCDLVVTFVRMLSAAHEMSTSVPVQKHSDGPAKNGGV
ncbi:hypothetical protein PG988_002373 [Apiospora saccharicola]